ncbi:MAG TPA: YCF48-related protein [Terriglobales bacterium]|nr:YCF48-related protein [Terriglobales bacterium]
MDTLKKLASRRLNSQPVGQHPDPELLTLLAENSISRRDRSKIFEHLSACSDCRNIFYLALPETADNQQAFALPRKQPRFGFRWATLAASVIIVGAVLISNRAMFTEHSVQNRDIATYSAPEVTSPKTEAAVQERTEPTPAADETRPRVRPPAKHMTAAPQASLQFDQSGEVHFAAAPAARDANAAFAQSDRPATAKTKQLDSRNIVSSPSAIMPAWRISSEGSPERSFDGGHSWQPVSVQDGVRFQAISAMGHDVWLGGNAGNLYHSADAGQSWDKVVLTSDSMAPESNIVRIDFSDPQDGLLTTANGRIWSTSDGGKNWQLK